MILLKIGLDGQEPVVERLAHAFPTTEDLKRHEVLAEDSRDEDAVLFRDDFFGDAAFFFDEEGGVAVCIALVLVPLNYECSKLYGIPLPRPM